MAAPVPAAVEVARVRSLPALAGLEHDCRRCDLYRDATQVVPGRGRRRAALMLVGEQPGNREDLAGEPFIGPAGRMLADGLALAGIDPDQAFVTNAVKHFKFQQRGKRRLHKSPAIAEIEACGVWLEQELRLVQPKVVVALGASAARALLRRRVVLRDLRGTLRPYAERQLLITVHPSYLLRIPDHDDRQRERRRFVDELRIARTACD